ncbi:hypothetical protein [Stieleria mannarensis]|uniref:hypothetical protein n=1 Tax=Stieleria mannarensis TaxID=2755585 RepID=UPI00160323A4|nr:hypothetical protein [Rhodopirellula sp. JC639]
MGHDAFLDIVANLVGILIILVVVLGAQSEAILRDAKPKKVEPVDPKARVAGEAEMRSLATVAARAASAQADSMRLERTIKLLDSKIAQQAERRTILLTLLTEAEAAWEDEQAKLDDARREAALRNAEAEELKTKLTEMVGARTQLETEQPPVVAISHLPTPMAKTVFGEEVYFRLKDDRLSVIPFKLLTEEIGRNFRRTSGSLREGVSDAAVGPVRGYVARYVLSRSNELVSDGNAIARMSRARVVVASFEPLQEPHGTPIEEVLANDDWLDVELSRYPAETTTVTVAVYPDSYGSFRKLREKIYAKGYASAARPIKDGSPIYVNFAGGGTRSVAQ